MRQTQIKNEVPLLKGTSRKINQMNWYLLHLFIFLLYLSQNQSTFWEAVSKLKALAALIQIALHPEEAE